ncbi:outer membrane beta-barrel protein [Colwellia marinimaniae]|uniref:outer membrane beta-barrel protein n=1 Tax=Colwellia marinimaniae TaxID=1513592 RepID=UPI0034D9790F
MTVCVLTSTATFATQSPNWSYAEIGYIKGSVSSLEQADFTGIHLEGSVSFHENFFAFGRYRDISDSFNRVDVEANLLNLGLGYRHGINDKTDFFTTASFASISTKVSYLSEHESNDNNGYELSLGVRSMLTDSFEFMTAISYEKIEGNDTSFKFAGFYHFTENISAGVNFQLSTDVQYLTFSARYSF